jgi:hypothetical protein
VNYGTRFFLSEREPRKHQNSKPNSKEQVATAQNKSAGDLAGKMRPCQMISGFYVVGVAVNKPAFWAITIALAFFAINLAQIGRFGMSFDEPEGMERGRQTVALVAGLFGKEDESQMDQGSDWLHHHPSFYATCNYGVSCFLIQRLGWAPIPAGHFLNLLTASAGLVVLFYLGRRLFNPTVGLVAVIFMVLFPRFIAHAHFNAKDVPVMVLGTLALLLLHVAAGRGQTRYWILAGLGFAAAVTTKLDGLFVLPIFLIPWLVRSLRSNHRRSDLRKFGWFSAASFGFIFLFWPELWTDPLRLIRSVLDFSGGFRDTETSYLGQSYPMNYLPWHYIPLNLLSVTPLALAAAVGLGAAWSLRDLFRWRAAFEHTLLWCWILAPVLPRLLPGVTRYDGMRHVFLVVPALALLAGFGVAQLLAHCQNRAGRRLVPAALCGALIWSGWQVVECHPCEAYYLNEAVRATVPGPKLGDYFDFFGWGSLNTQGVEWINAHAPPKATVAIGEDVSRLHFYGLRDNLQPIRDVDQADYAVVGCWRQDLMEHFHSAPVFSVRCYDMNLVCVYAKGN